MLSITSPAQEIFDFQFPIADYAARVERQSEIANRESTISFGGYGWIRTTNLALMRRLLCP